MAGRAWPSTPLKRSESDLPKEVLGHHERASGTTHPGVAGIPVGESGGAAQAPRLLRTAVSEAGRAAQAELCRPHAAAPAPPQRTAVAAGPRMRRSARRAGRRACAAPRRAPGRLGTAWCAGGEFWETVRLGRRRHRKGVEG
eukprot:gene19066-biopygen929